MWEAYRANLDGQSFRNTTWYLGNKATLGLSDDIKVKVVGVWDTVGALVCNYLQSSRWSLFTDTLHVGHTRLALGKLARSQQEVQIP